MGEEPHSGLEKANNAYISAKLLKVLGNDILGKQLTWKVFPNFHITVAGVFEDFPENTHLPKIDIAVALPTIGQIMGDGRDNWLGNDRYSAMSAFTRVLIRKHWSPTSSICCIPMLQWKN